MAAAAGAVTVDVVLVVAVTPAVGVWEDERVRTGVSGGDWLPVVVTGGALATTEANTGKSKQRESGFDSGLACGVSGPAISGGNELGPGTPPKFASCPGMSSPYLLSTFYLSYRPPLVSTCSHLDMPKPLGKTG